MKKILLSALILIATCLPSLSFAFTFCTLGGHGFCGCFYNDCAEKVGPAAALFLCTSTALKLEIAAKGGVNTVCRAQHEVTTSGHKLSYKDCIDATYAYFLHC